MGRKVIWAPRAAKLVADVFSAAESLSDLPDRGRVVPELSRSKHREIFVGRYRLIYRVGVDYVAIVAFVHGARDFRSWWRRYRADSLN